MEIEIERAKVLGFCMGVRRAIKIIEDHVLKEPLVTLGTIVHNPHVVRGLEEKGARVVSSLDEAQDAVAITAHGVGEEVYEEIKRRGLRLVDTTCPIVSKAQRAARKLVDEGFKVIIYGEADHKEVRGVLGWTRGQGIAILDPETPVEIPRRKVALISQTTKGPEAFVRFISKFLEKNMDNINELRIINTTCPETNERYAAIRDLASRSDLLIVVGGRDSANTRMLAKICQNSGVETHHIEDAEEIRPEWLRGKRHVGLTAGASTPDSSIEEVVERLKELAAQFGL